MHGWMGEILQVDLSRKEITRFPTQPYAAKYLGGRGIGMALYWEKVKPKTGAFDPENCLIFMTGPVVATGTQGASMLSVVGKSPATIPEGYCYGSFTGFVGAELKKAGLDGLVVTGRAEHPVYILIEDNKIEIKDASQLWGKHGGYQTGEELKKIHGDKTRFIAIGKAGENRVRTAIALATHDCTVSAGFGAVFGSKNLKAIAIRGSGKVSVAHPEELRDLTRYTNKIGRRVRLTHAPHIVATGRTHLLEVIGKGNCYLCGSECVAGVYRYGGEYIAHRKCQSVEYYLPWVYGQEDEPVETFYKAPELANDYGFDTWELTSVIDWLYDCYKAGALTEAETGLPLSRIGTREFLDKLLHAIASREGFGDLLAEGLMRASEKAPEAARKLLRRTVAPIGMNYLFQPRMYTIMALLYPPEPRVHHINYHDIPFVHIAWQINLAEPGSTGVTTELVHEIARDFWGSEPAANFSGWEGQALAAKNIQHRTYLKEMLGLCDWDWPILYSLDTEDHRGDPELEGRIFTAVTDMPAELLDEYAERVFNLQRLILLREGRQPEADYPPQYHFTEPLKSGKPDKPHMLVPGPGDSAVDAAGRVLDWDKYLEMLREYYRLRGWNEATGVPEPATLEKLGLDNLNPRFKTS